MAPNVICGCVSSTNKSKNNDEKCVSCKNVSWYCDQLCMTCYIIAKVSEKDIDRAKNCDKEIASVHERTSFVNKGKQSELCMNCNIFDVFRGKKCISCNIIVKVAEKNREHSVFVASKHLLRHTTMKLHLKNQRTGAHAERKP